MVEPAGEALADGLTGLNLGCQRVCARITPGDFLGQTLPKRAPKPAYNLLEIFKMARAVRKPIVEEVLAGTNLSLERADLLVILLLEHPAYAGQVPSQSWSGFVPFATIRNSMVHSISPSKFLLSRWLRDLERLGLVEQRALDAKRKAARLTTKGVEVTTPILSKYSKLVQDLLESVPSAHRIAHIETNDAVVKAVQPYGKKDSIRRVAAE